MKARPRIAVVGCGYWGSKHIRVFHELSSACLALTVDSRQERLDYIRDSYPGVATAQNYEDALNADIDGIILATPISSHYRLARRALLAGKHVLVEKPLATTSEECRELIALAEERKLTLMVGHTFEYNPAVAYLRDLVLSGDLGNLYYIDSARLNLGLFQHDADVLWDLAPHDLSIIFHILDVPALSISARGSAHILPNTPDVAFADLAFQNGITAHLRVSWLDPCKVRRVTIVGSKKMVVFNDVAAAEKIRIYDKRFTMTSSGDQYSDWRAGYHNGNVVMPPISGAEPLGLECQDFVRSISTGSPVRADGYHGLRVVAALEAASRSLANDGRVESLIATAPNDHILLPTAPTTVVENSYAAYERSQP
jgi:predicted dehydrogenase